MALPDPKPVKDIIDVVTKLPDLVKTGDEARKAPVAFLVFVVGFGLVVLIGPQVGAGPAILMAIATIILAVWADDRYG